MNRKPFVLEPEKYTTTRDLRNSELMRALIRHGAVIKREPKSVTLGSQLMRPSSQGPPPGGVCNSCPLLSVTW